MKVGIVGFPGAGKSTVFNALTGLKIGTRAHGDHLGVIKVPDQRLETLAEMLKVEKKTPVEITFMDLAPGKDQKVSNLNQINHIKEADVLAEVARCFTDPLSQSPPSPVREIRDFQADLKLADLAIIEGRLARLKKEKGRGHEKDLLERCRAFIEEERSLRLLSLSDEETKMLSGFGFLSQKPPLILLNLGEEQIGKPLPEELASYLVQEHLEAVSLCGKLEMEMGDLKEEERLELLKELEISESARDRFVRSCYRLLQLVSFLTHNEEEVRAWSVKRDTPALKAAGKVHSDMERGFIRAEVVRYEDFVRYGSEARCREAGKLRLEGKDYIVQDGDIIRFRFHV